MVKIARRVARMAHAPHCTIRTRIPCIVGFMSRMMQAPVDQPPPFPENNRHWLPTTDEKPTYRYRLAACRKDPAEVIVRRLSCHAAPSDTAVFYKELRVTLRPARSVPRRKHLSVSLNSAWRAAAWSPAAREDSKTGDARFEPVP